MEPLRIPLVELRRPVEVQLPNGAWHRVKPYGAEHVALLRQFRAEPDPVARVTQLADLVKAALPETTEADLLDTTAEDWVRIVGAAAGKLEIMEEILKNGVSGGVDLGPPPTPPSNPTTKKRGRSRASAGGKVAASPR